MKVLVTGAAGFIGNELSLRLVKEGHEVTGVDCFSDYYDVSLKRDRVKRLDAYEHFRMHEVKVEDEAAMTMAFRHSKPDVVVHLAAQAGVRYSLEHPREYISSNIVGSFNVIELVCEAKNRYQRFSSLPSCVCRRRPGPVP